MLRMDPQTRALLIGGAASWLLAFGLALVFIPDHERVLAVFGVGTLVWPFVFGPVSSAAAALADRWS